MTQQFHSIRFHPSGKQFAADHIGGMAIILVLLGIAGYEGLAPKVIFPYLLIAALLLFVYLTYHYIYTTRMVYVINEEQLKYEYGIFVCQIDFIELYRVVDYSEQRSFLQVLFGIKTVSIYSGDRTTPRLDIIGVDKNTDLISEIRNRVEYNKTRRGIHEFTNIK